MLSQLFSNPLLFVISLVGLLIAITVHEFSHAAAAEHLGDPTPRLQGRLSLNPLVHIDPIGALLLLVIGFGWGKPVIFDQFNLKNPRRDAALISIAGPLSNFIVALLLSIILRAIIFLHLSSLETIGYLILAPIIALNIVLGVFNLLPIHPLDGFKIVGGLLSEEQAKQWYELQRYGYIFLILLFIPMGTSSLLDSIIRPVITVIVHFLIPQSTGFI